MSNPSEVVRYLHLRDFVQRSSRLDIIFADQYVTQSLRSSTFSNGDSNRQSFKYLLISKEPVKYKVGTFH